MEQEEEMIEDGIGIRFGEIGEETWHAYSFLVVDG